MPTPLVVGSLAKKQQEEQAMNDEDLGVMKQQIKSLETKVKELEKNNEEQEALINRGKGAFYLLSGLGAIVTMIWHMLGLGGS